MSTEPVSLSKIVAASRTQLHYGLSKLGLKKTFPYGQGQVPEPECEDKASCPLEKQIFPLGEISSNSPYHPQVAHVLGPQNTSAARIELQTNITQLKAVLQNYQSLLMAAKTNPDSQAVNMAFSRINCAESGLTMTEEAKRVQKQNQLNFRLTQAKRRLTYHLESSRDRNAFYTMTLKSMARDLKMDYFSDDHGNFCTMMICGKLIVLDIDISTAGDILKVKVNHPNAEHFSEKIDKMMLDDLKCFNMAGVYSNIAALASIDSYSSKYGHIDFLHAFRALGHDLEFIHGIESTTTGGLLRSHLLNGHGIPLAHYKHWGPSLVCWCPPTSQLPASVSEFHTWMADNTLPKEAQQVYFELDLVVSAHPFLPPHIEGYLHPADWNLKNDDQSLFVKSSFSFEPFSKDQCSVITHQSSTLLAPLQWALVLDPPLVADHSSASQLTGISFASVSHGMPLFQDVMLGKIFSDSSVQLDPGHSYFSSDVFVARLKSCPTNQRYRMAKDCAPITCQTIYRVPFSHPRDLLGIIQVLRQQNIFNALFKSCFNTKTFLGPALASKLEAIDIEISLHSLPISISTRIHCPDEALVLTFYPQLSGSPVVVDYKQAAKLLPFSKKIDHLIVNSLNIPLVVAFILNKLT